MQGCEEAVVFAAVAAWAHCHEKLARLADDLHGCDSPAAIGSPYACHSPVFSNSGGGGGGGGGGSSSSSSDSEDLLDMLPDPALDQ